MNILHFAFLSFLATFYTHGLFICGENVELQCQTTTFPDTSEYLFIYKYLQYSNGQEPKTKLIS